MEVFVIRHTPVDVPRQLCYGQMEVPLAASFATEAAGLQQALPQPIEEVWSSPLFRCRQLAEQFSPDYRVDPRLLELDFGVWEGMRWDEINPDALTAWMEDYVHVQAGGGENFLQMYERVQELLEEARSLDRESLLLVTHGGVIRCIWGYLLHIPLTHLFKIKIGYGEILHFKLTADPVFDVILRKQ